LLQCIPGVRYRISAACRSVPVIYFFRTGMLPCSLLLVLYWLINDSYLSQLQLNLDHLRKVILICGISGALFLILYVIFLGVDGELYRFLRRFGIYVFFGGTALAQLLCVVARRKLAGEITPTVATQGLIVATMLVFGPINLIQKALLEKELADRIENVIEWNFGLLLCLFFIVSAWQWRIGENQ